MNMTRLPAMPVPGICGVDEAGRGPLAGPVYAAAVVLDPRRPVDGLRDSKRLSARQRDRLALLIRERAQGWAIASASAAEIDAIDILQASLLAMRRAVLALACTPSLVRVDGNRAPTLEFPVETVIGGDDSDPAIAAASILAKTARDEYMLRIHAEHPGYGFDRHKGYPTAAHLECLARLGPCEHHRRSFAPVRRLLGQGS
ncbi:MAG: ribonuclease HII [Burkholderiaceae bacterium]|jgi:ribonuclease HII|nr:ribonuclease HII [Burkholderiaceae bacterium]MEB2320285.1 ribonuclease HII [Pseudomonadota bacterium]